MRPQLGKDKILEAAVRQFAKTGYHATSISQIATAASVSKGLMYNYFKSKEELLLAIINQASSDMHDVAHAMSAPEISDQASYEKALRDFLDQYCQFLRNNREYLSFQLSLLFQPDLKEIVQAPLQLRAERLLAVTEEMFRSAGAATPSLTARRFMTELDGIALHELSVFKDFPLNEMLGQLFLHYKDLRTWHIMNSQNHPPLILQR